MWKLMICAVVLLSVVYSVNTVVPVPDVDPSGYVMYCPCMGRFGNQADHFLGVLSFAKGLNRTLVLPPWVEYHPAKMKSVQIPFDTYFRVPPLEEYHRMITMENFMQHLSPSIWPVGKRTAFCYSTRGKPGEDQGCHAKDGNPFGPFWDTFNIDFDSSQFYGPLSYDTTHSDVAKEWNAKFPPKKVPVLAFTGAPAAFPVREEHLKLHKYLVWSNAINAKANKFISNHLKRPFLGVHMRNGMDWNKACAHVVDGRQLFASAQCLGYRMEHGQLTEEICLPKQDTVLAQIKAQVTAMKARSVFIATDNNPMVEAIIDYLDDPKIKVLTKQPTSPHVDLAILGKADHYIGNCVSTFSAFATRERLANGNKPTTFWAFPSAKHEEL